MPVWGASTSLLSNAKMNSIVEGQKSGIELERRDKTSVISDGDGLRNVTDQTYRGERFRGKPSAAQAVC